MRGTIRRAAVGLTMAAVAISSSIVAAPPASAGTDPVAASVAWLASKVNAKGVVKTTAGAPDPTGTADWSATAETLVSIGLNGGDPALVAKMASALSKHEQVAVLQSDDGFTYVESAGKLAALSLAALVSKQVNPQTSPLKPRHLVARLVGTQRSNGLFGRSDPTYDGVLRQGLAVMAIALSGQFVRYSSQLAKATSWLLKQQCDGGGFPSLKKAPGPGCSGDPGSYLGPDSNSTALAIVALVATGAASGPSDPLGKALAWLEGQELSSASWGWYPTNAADASSTAFAILALGVAGRDPSSTTGPLSRGGVAPFDALRSFADPAGGFSWQPGAPADLISTNEALLVIGASKTT